MGGAVYDEWSVYLGVFNALEFSFGLVRDTL